MSPLDAAILILILMLPLHCLVLRYLEQLADPAYVREHGVVIVRESALQARSEPIGEYKGHPIWGTVTFKGMVYRFHHIAQGHKHRIAPRELLLEPHLVYVTD
jgi:hypothetical protein